MFDRHERTNMNSELIEWLIIRIGAYYCKERCMPERKPLIHGVSEYDKQFVFIYLRIVAIMLQWDHYKSSVG